MSCTPWRRGSLSTPTYTMTVTTPETMEASPAARPSPAKSERGEVEIVLQIIREGTCMRRLRSEAVEEFVDLISADRRHDDVIPAPLLGDLPTGEQQLERVALRRGQSTRL